MFKYLIGVSKYGASIKNAILNLKFRGKSCYSESLAKMIFDRIEKLPEKENFDTIVYAPISYQRFKQRGYNQAKLIAYELSKLLDVPVTDALVKIRDTVPQSSLSYKERKTNLKNSIVPRVMLDGMNILLVDDVYTTGATAEACIQALKASNAKSIVVAVAAISGEDFYDGKNNII